MFPLILVLFLVVPIVELYVIVQVAGGIGVLETLGLLIVVSIVGAWLVKAQGIGLVRRVQAKLASGEMPGKELVDGALIVFAGALMLTPGFVTDTVGLLLLLPPTRAIVRTFLMKRFTVMADAKVASFGFGPGTTSGRGPTVFGFGSSQVFDVDGHESDTDPRTRRPGPDTPPNREIVDLSRDDDPSDEPPPLGR
ncbi:MAG: FxsA family protein [Acidimicrobiales bacterium]